MIEKIFDYPIVFFSTLALTLVLTPLVRELNRRMGMVDKPDPRRINRVPIPRGGGIAIVLGVLIPYMVYHFVSGRPFIQGLEDAVALKITLLAVLVALLGFADDRLSLSPRVKLAGQIAIASAVWWWAGLGFRALWPALPAPVDCALTIFWIIGAINAFNLIDGLDGLASGLALIAVIGMAGALIFSKNPQATLFYFALAGGLVAFLRYNWHPASVFLGDSGSMFLGFTLAVLPLASQAPNSFLVSIGVPLLSMGVPIFDTSLAILRRSLRRLTRTGSAASGEVMTADTDHLHHRILRATGLNQRKTACILYAFALFGVGAGLVAMTLESKAAGLWLVVFAIALAIIFRDASVELFEAGKLLNDMARDSRFRRRRHFARLAVPLYIVYDCLALAAAFFIGLWTMNIPVNWPVCRVVLLVRVVAVFLALAFFGVYATAWSRAMISNFVRLLLACVFGSIAGSAFIYYWPSMPSEYVNVMTWHFAMLGFLMIAGGRCLRGFIRDLFYALDCRRIAADHSVSRVLVYGSGLRYRSFRRELVRHTAMNGRVIVGLIDDDILLKGRFVGRMKVLGTINDAPELIKRLKVDSVVIACEMSDAWLEVVMEILRPTGVKVSQFSFAEKGIA